VNEAFDNDSSPGDTGNNFSLCNGFPAATAADERRNVEFIVIIHEK
jgi:hypothetical protein